MPIPTTFEVFSDGGGASSSDATTTTRLAQSVPYQAPAVVVPSDTINCSNGNYFESSVNGNVTYVFSGVPTSGSYSFTLEVAHTSGSITWPASVVWPNNAAPSLTTGKTHLFMFATSNAGTTWRGSFLINYTS